MTQTPMFPVVAVDGGGSRCRIALAEGDTVFTVETGPANVSTDFDGGMREILSGLASLAQRSARTLEELSRVPAFVGLAGAIEDDIVSRVETALPFIHIRVADDRPAALRGALGDRDGAVAHCGTGSFFAVRSGGRERFAGGWGPILGDEASAQWVGRAALRVALECADGRHPPSGLSDQLLSDLGGTGAIVRFAAAARPADFGALAPIVTGHAGRGDALAVRVMKAAADEISRTLSEIGWRDDLALCLTGGIGPLYAPYLPEDMRHRLIGPAGDPLSGALSLARDLAREIRDESC